MTDNNDITCQQLFDTIVSSLTTDDDDHVALKHNVDVLLNAYTKYQNVLTRLHETLNYEQRNRLYLLLPIPLIPVDKFNNEMLTEWISKIKDDEQSYDMVVEGYDISHTLKRYVWSPENLDCVSRHPTITSVYIKWLSGPSPEFGPKTYRQGCHAPKDADGNFHGTVTYFHALGMVREQVSYQHGKKLGRVIAYYDDRYMYSERVKLRGENIDAHIRERYSYNENGNLDGDYQEFHSNGSWRTICYYKDGKKHGDYKSWYETPRNNDHDNKNGNRKVQLFGQVREVATYDNDERVGPYTCYENDGNKISERDADGRCTSYFEGLNPVTGQPLILNTDDPTTSPRTKTSYNYIVDPETGKQPMT